MQENLIKLLFSWRTEQTESDPEKGGSS